MSTPTFELIAATLPWIVDPSVALAAAKAGALGVLDLEHAHDLAVPRAAVERLVAEGGGRVGLKLDAASDELVSIASSLSAGALDAVLLVPRTLEETKRAVARLRPVARRILLEVHGEADAVLAESLPVDGLIAKGNEAGGWAGTESTFVLLQRLVARGRLPVWAHGGIGAHSAAACLAGGAAGVVLDGALALSRESPLPDEARRAIAQMDGTESVCLGEELGQPVRLYARPGSRAPTEVRAASAPLEQRAAVSLALARSSAADPMWPLGQDIAFAEPLARRHRTVAGILDAVRRSVAEHVRDAQATQPLAEGSPLAQSLGTRFPILQGPMTRVSDVGRFAERVAQAGALPFLALALNRGSRVRSLLAETRAALGPRPWGVGILGFVPEAVRAEQLEALRTEPPPFALIAGGRPDQAEALERQGIPTFLHVPSAALLRSFLEQGVRRFVFEGRECGGHVGPLSSFVLWDRVIDTLLEALPQSDDGHPCQVIFAGGIHDARSGAMAAAMAGPLAARGVEVGVLMGTAYLFTREAVESGAIMHGFQEEALHCDGTVLLETGPGHLVRAVPTRYVSHFRAQRSTLLASGKPTEEVLDALESLNLGRLRLAAKGERRSDGAGAEDAVVAFPDAQQRAEGLYMIGQVAALREGLVSMEELHRDVAHGAAERLRQLRAPEGPQPRRRMREEKPADIALIGMGCLFPGSRTPSAYWDNILDQVDAITEAPPDRFDARAYFDPDPRASAKAISKWGGFFGAVPFDPVHHGIPPSAVPSIEPVQLLALEVVEAALRDAGYLDRPFGRDRTSVIFGVAGIPDLAIRYILRAAQQVVGRDALRRLGTLPEWTEDTFAGTLDNVVAGRVANRFDLGGANFTVDAACATSMAAVHVAVRELAAGSSDLVIAGAADACQNPLTYLNFSATGAFSKDGRCRPFDHRANGIVISEGIAAVVLKRLEDAEQDGDRIYAVLKGIAASSDGRALGLTAPRSEGQVASLERAYRAAGISPREIGLLEAHGTGTVAGDRAEVLALRTVYQQAGVTAQSCAIGSVKSMIGHTKSAAGLAGMIKAALALHHRVLPPTMHVERPDPRLQLEASPFYPNVETRPWLEAPDHRPRRAAVSAFGFGGTNFHAVLEEAPHASGVEAASPVTVRWPAELLLLRGHSATEVMASAVRVEQALANGAEPTLAELAKAASRSSGPLALAVVVTSLADAREKLSEARGQLVSGAQHLRDPRGIYFSNEPLLSTGGRVAFLFPGQGSQYVGMGRELAVHFREVRHAIEHAEEVLAGQLPRRLSSYLFPPPTFEVETERAANRELTATEIAQPAIGAVSFGMLRLLEALGLCGDLLAGHSYGEYVALCAAGVFSEDTLYRLSLARGRCLAAASQSSASQGKMAAVEAAPEVVAEAIASLDGVWIANRNGPRQTVISGTADGIERAVAHLAAHDIAARMLPVACAFHSPLVEAAQAPLADVLSRVEFASPTRTVLANVTAAPYPAERAAIASLLREQVVRPVDFVGQVKAMYQAGARVFVEVGPREVLSGLTAQILAGEDHLSVSVDAPGRSALVQLLHTLGLAAAEGAPVVLDRLLVGRVARELHLDQLEDESRPAPLSPTTWLVDGSWAHPPPGGATVAPSAALEPTLDLGVDLPAPPADLSDAAMARWQQLMGQFLDLQREVMLAYVQGSKVAPKPGESNVAVESTRAAPISSSAERGWSRERLLTTLQRLASEKTGYQSEMLKPELRLDADLGVGSLKRMELLSGLAARTSMPPQVLRGATERLMSFKTLGSLADAFLELLGGPGALHAPSNGVPGVTAEEASSKGDATSRIGRHLFIPVEAPPGSADWRLEGTILVTDDEGGVALSLIEELRRSGAHPVLLRDCLSSASAVGEALLVSFRDAEAVTAAVEEARRRHGPIGGIFHLLPLRASSPGATDWHARIGTEVKGLFHLARATASSLGGAEHGGFVVAATRGGVLSRRESGGDAAPIHGALAGMIKTFAREWPKTRCKVVDLDSSESPSLQAQLLGQEGRLNGVDVELGYRASKRMAMRPSAADFDETEPTTPLFDDTSVLLITGGAGGITAEVAHELATRYRPTLLLVGRSPAPTDESFETSSLGPRELRAFLGRQLGANGDTSSVAEIERQCQRLQQARRLRQSLAALAKTGATVRYFSVDVADEAKFGGLIDELYAAYGRIDGAIHGAGIAEDGLIAEKEPAAFDRVFDPKVQGALVLARKLRPETLKLLVFFSSISGSFGNRGQVDYAAANAFLNGLAADLDARWPTRVVSMAWGPWDLETGIMTRELVRQFRARGIPLIAPAVGRRAADAELRRGRKGEVEVLLGPARGEW